jgi:ketosteroid isomerase-like protein
MGNLGDDGVRVLTHYVEVHVAGEVGWAEGRGRFTHPGGAERPARFTAVLLREDGRWRVVQSHASIGLPNEDMFG